MTAAAAPPGAVEGALRPAPLAVAESPSATKPGRRRRAPRLVTCQALGCAQQLNDLGSYYVRNRLCLDHMRAEQLWLAHGPSQRFCQARPSLRCVPRAPRRASCPRPRAPRGIPSVRVRAQCTPCATCTPPALHRPKTSRPAEMQPVPCPGGVRRRQAHVQDTAGFVQCASARAGIGSACCGGGWRSRQQQQRQ
jgi:hypothetical protein